MLTIHHRKQSGSAIQEDKTTDPQEQLHLKNNKQIHAGQGLVNGICQMGAGAVGGVLAGAAMPFIGAQAAGAKGFVGGLVAAPFVAVGGVVGGVAGGTYKVAEGLMNTPGVGPGLLLT